MAERRMFAKSIVTSDLFLDMPMSARCLYFTFGMFADDDGFINSPKSIMRQIGASVDDFNILLAKKYIYSFESGVIVIKHWKVNNYLQKDRYRQTACVAELNTLEVGENGTYSMKTERCIQDVYIPYTQDRIGKDNISHESHACAHEGKADQKGCTFGKKEFLEKYPKLKDDLPTGLEDPEADWQGLSDAFKQSEWLRGVDSLVWVLQNSGKILSGKYKTFKSADSKTSHFENERQYGKDELNSLLTNIDDVDF